MSTLTDDMRLDLVNHLKDDLTDIEHRLTTATCCPVEGSVNSAVEVCRRKRESSRIGISLQTE